MMTATRLLCVLCLLTAWDKIQGKTVQEWKTRTIYQLLTDRFSPEGSAPSSACADLRSWCGGNFRGIAQRLDYIKDLGANAIWISPIVLNTLGGFHGYWAKDIYQIDPHFGTEQDLTDLIAAAHEKDIWVMVDVVPNHMGYPLNCSWSYCMPGQELDFDYFVPFNKSEYYHTYCEITDYNDQTQVELCRLADLPDLNQSVPIVRQTLKDWISSLTTRLGVDGYRIDTTRHIALDFWPEYQQAAGVYCMGEVSHNDYQYVARYQGPNALDGVLHFPLNGAIKNVYHYGQNMTLLEESLHKTSQYFHDAHALGVFVDNHDMARFLHESPDVTKLKNALTYSFFTEGIPVIYYGTEQELNGGNDPQNRESLWPYYDTQSEMYQFIKEVLAARNELISSIVDSPQEIVFVDENSLFFTRAENKILVAITNVEKGVSVTREISLSDVPQGTKYENIRDSADVITIEDGKSSISLEQGDPKIYVRIDGASSATTASINLSLTLNGLFCVWLLSCDKS